MQNRLLYDLQANVGFLNGAEQKIARAILKDPKAFTACSLVEFANRAGVSQGSVVNFAKKFTGGGFPTLKVHVAESAATFEVEPFSSVKAPDDIKTVFQKTIENVYVAFRCTLALNKEDVMQRVAERILQAKRVLVFGIGSSAIPARYFRLHLLRLGF